MYLSCSIGTVTHEILIAKMVQIGRESKSHGLKTNNRSQRKGEALRKVLSKKRR